MYLPEVDNAENNRGNHFLDSGFIAAADAVIIVIFPSTFNYRSAAVDLVGIVWR
jgi:hypothetical protein